MTSPFSFKGDIGRVAYASMSLATFFTQHAFAYLVMFERGVSLDIPWWFWMVPLRVAAQKIDFRPEWLMLAGLCVLVIVMWMLLALAYRRIRTIGYDGASISLMTAPGIQLLMVAWLTNAPALAREPVQPAVAAASRTRVVVLGLLTGTALSVAAAALSTLVLGIYGFGLFVASPFVVGMTVASIAKRNTDLGLGQTTFLVMCSLGLGALILIGLAMEGVVCLLFASPLIALMGFLGAVAGRLITNGRPGFRAAPMSVALLPLLLVSELLLPPAADFESVESVDIAASPSAVWESVVHMGPIPAAPAAPFSWGLAYPMSGEIKGTGVGAVRRGVFSTGIAYERVVEWVPERRLSFIVLSDPPSMRELSPYAHVNAPHTQGYFRTRDARFRITPLPDGRTRLTLATHHDLDLEPALYWLPFAQWAVHANKTRVLKHFQQQAEDG
ncbi:MAG TPA: hypothetical protein VN645_11905 [Steroidobacteraceae bacterium]|nr:hypothetical protein [Steroidobacteraceae bacterium]